MKLQLTLSEAGLWYNRNCDNCDRLQFVIDPKTGYQIESPYSCHVHPAMASLAIIGHVVISDHEQDFVFGRAGKFDQGRECRNLVRRKHKRVIKSKYRFNAETDLQGSLF